MKRVGKKFYSWASQVDQETLDQVERISWMPFVEPHVSLMPDAHLGKGAAVGSVIPTRGAVIPSAVGVDLGCGMVAVRTQWTEDQVRARGDLRALREGIEARVPMSAGKYTPDLTNSAVAFVQELEGEWNYELQERGISDFSRTWRNQLGTLGGGNHFIEIVADEEGRVWAFLHSGSRGIGNKIATHFMNLANEYCRRNFIDVDRDLAYLVEGTQEFDQYMNAVEWAQRFAYLNREEMMIQTLSALEGFMAAPVEKSEEVNCHHNFMQREHHHGRNLIVTRKGAIEAREGQYGLIPGSMGTASYVVKGRGNAMSFNSAPHGAGRNFSRRKARETFTHDDLRAAMSGIEYRDTDAFVDEIPGAYKDIDQVMADAADLVSIVHEFRQIVNCKGD
ncbi:RtcB family protein [Brevibacterium sp. SMBL_HHYL_HB1]|uniref:RtcB family protein n=1 Tax=Brevibacterium sp. SMBL_HHYL_HB1 TaxID=2777556 RepID=UPI001BAC1DC3|nr:RtcB family protein [Brevibacterium sp. SMBL_HHYL_HB1]QUL79899.1 RtcB family protein [Brevibacterium sp. SMBL_HHYL_HB1]